MTHLLNISLNQLADELAQRGQPAYRAKQILEWIWRKQATRFDEMTNVPAGLRETLAEILTIFTASRVADSRSTDGTIKLLLDWEAAGGTSETVLIPDENPDGAVRNTACVSTQVGCAFGCSFCASGMDGFERNLSAGEILEQVLQLQDASQKAVTNVVYMGTGEPLANYDATVASVRALMDPQRGGISARRITVSTVGIPDAISQLAQEDLPITLAISLHASNDALRQSLMPSAAAHPLREVLDAAEQFYHARHREVTLEYTLLGGVNDSVADADALGDLLRTLRCNVNLLRYNPIPSLPFSAASDNHCFAFADRLTQRGIRATLRRSRGLDADAACGQLRRKFKDEPRGNG